MKHANMDPNKGRAGVGHAFSAAGAPALPARSRKVKNLAVPCPECKAEVGERCTPVTNTQVHTSRRRMAVRLSNKEREEAGTLSAVDFSARKPGALEDPEGVYCSSCGLTIKKNVAGKARSHSTQGGYITTRAVCCPGPSSEDR